MTISEKIRTAVLAGRRIAQKPEPQTATLAPDQARQTLERFADLLRQLSTSRAEMDKAQKLAADSRGVDLAELMLEGKPLPDLAGLAANAESTRLRTAALRQALDRLTTDASRATQALKQHEVALLEALESGVKDQIERPGWMSPEDFGRQLMQAPAMQEIERLRQTPKPQLPMVLNGSKGKALKNYRVEPAKPAANSYGHSEDQFNPALLGAELSAWVSHLANLEALRATDLL